MPITRKPGKKWGVSETAETITLRFPASEEDIAEWDEAFDAMMGKTAVSPLRAAEKRSNDVLGVEAIDLLSHEYAARIHQAMNAESLSPEWYAGNILRTIKSLRAYAARGDIQGALDEASKVGWLFRQWLADEHQVVVKRESNLLRRRDGARRGTKEREEALGRAGWEVRARPIFEKLASEGATNAQIRDAIYDVEQRRARRDAWIHPVTKKTISNHVCRWRTSTSEKK